MMRKGSILLQLKFTGLFVAFGLLIGFLSYFTSTVTTAKIMADTFLNTDTNPVGKILSEHPHDWIYAIFTQNDSSSARNLFKDIIPPEFKKSISLAFYYQKKGGNTWYLLKDTARPEQRGGRTDDKDLTASLAAALQKGIVESKHTFFNFSSSHILYFRATSTGDTNNYVIKTTINRKNMLDYILDKRNEGLPYVIITLFFSLVIGFFFSKSITKPLRKLSGKALNFSEGNMTVRFHTTRKDDIGVLSRSLDQLALNISNRIATVQTMNKIDKAVNSSLSRRELLTKVIQFISEQFPDSILFIMEKHDDSYTLTASSPSGVIPVGLRIPYSRLSEVFSGNNPSPFELDKETISQINKQINPDLNKKQGMGIPLRQADKITGLLVFAGNTLSPRDRESLILLADQVGVALLALKEYTEHQRLYKGVVQALSRSIDAKSQWTAGHSERVAKFSVKLAQMVQPEKKVLDSIEIAALLHDIGKLGIPEEILDKQGKLDDNEQSLIQEHPVIGHKIVADIPDFKHVQDAIRHHHEHWDGTGYPDKLSGDAIPLTARIISIADVWDAITADRPYRKGFSGDEARTFMLSERERLFDPHLLDIFIKLI